jgi:hypothetical protein
MEIHMTGYWLASATALAMLTTAAVAQSPDAARSAQPAFSTNGAAGTYDSTTTTRSNDAMGVQTDKTETFEKSQTYTSGNGELRAGTSIRSGTTTVTAPPPPVATTTTTTTTTREERP